MTFPTDRAGFALGALWLPALVTAEKKYFPYAKNFDIIT